MRGALLVGDDKQLNTGIIPADAGSTPGGRRQAAQHGDHPRGCGEHTNDFLDPPSGRGSSPRMRGALDLLVDLGARPGIIPADAGSTDAYAKAHWEREDHPRGCGEHGHPDVG